MFKINRCVLSVLCVIISLSVHSLAFGELKVYDADNQYLGILIEHNGYGYTVIYMPSVNKVVRMYYSDPEKRYADLFGGDVIYYSNADCTGTAFSHNINRIPQFIVKDIYTNKYFIPTNDNVIVTPTQTIYGRYCRMGTCQCLEGIASNIGNSYGYNFIKLEEVVNPQIPFNTPVRLPFRYEYSSLLDVNGDGKTGLAEAIYSIQKAAGMR